MIFKRNHHKKKQGNKDKAWRQTTRFNHKNRLKYKVETEKKGYRNPKMTRHAKNTSCLDIINDIEKDSSQKEARK
jgi:ribosomal protein L32E